MKKLFLMILAMLQSCFIFAMQEVPKKTWSQLRAEFPDHLFLKGITEQKQVALTFSDATQGELTPAVLALLKEHKIPATFFIDGQSIEGFEGVVRQMYDEGHALGSQGLTHKNLTKLSEEELTAEIELTRTKLAEAVWPHDIQLFFRPPGGNINEAVVTRLKDAGYKIIIWSIDPQDWKKEDELTAEAIVAHVMEKIHPGAIVLMHLHEAHKDRSLASLAHLIPALQEAGLEIVKLSMLVGNDDMVRENAMSYSPSSPEEVGKKRAREERRNPDED